MNQPAGITVQWNGDESINTVRELIEKHHSVTLFLPQEVHHALFFYLDPDGARASLPELVSDRGDAKLLNEVAKIKGFAGIADLVKPAIVHKALVEVVSPTPGITFEFER